MKLFITGTDTNVGKTYISVGLLKAFTQKKMTTLGIKPIASGCSIVNNQLYNEDTLALQKASSIKLKQQKISPFMFQQAIAPHIAALKLKQSLSLAQLNLKTKFALEYKADIHLIEGFGGWYAPLNDQETMADFVKQHQFSVILVIGMRLGCLNHALLTAQALQKDKITTIGWIANCIHPEMNALQENIDCLQRMIPFPFLCTVRYQCAPEDVIDLGRIMVCHQSCCIIPTNVFNEEGSPNESRVCSEEILRFAQDDCGVT